MSSTSNSQNLLVNVFRPTYVYDANKGYIPKLVVSNVDSVVGISGTFSNLNVGDANSNVYIGINAGNPNAVAVSCNSSNVTAIGLYAGSNNSNCDGSVFMGNSAGSNASNVDNSVYLGERTGSGNSNCTNSVYIGYNSAKNLCNASNEVAIGTNTIAGGTSNIYIGTSTGSTGSSNIFIGPNIAPGNVSNQLRVGAGSNIAIYGDLTNQKLGINTDPTVGFDVSGEAFFNNKVGIQMAPTHSLDVAGQIYATQGVLIGAGSAAAPTIALVDDTDTGIFADSNASEGRSFGFSINGNKRVTVTDTCLNVLANLYVQGTFGAATQFGSNQIVTGWFRGPDSNGGNFDVSQSGISVGRTVNIGKGFIIDTCTNGYIRMLNDAGTVQTLDISGGNISNSATTRSSNFIGTAAASNSVGGVTLSNSRIGVGTSTPSYSVQVNSTLNPQVVVSNSNSGGEAAVSVVGNNTADHNNGLRMFHNALEYGLYSSNSTQPFRVVTNNQYRVSVLSDGKVGINTTAPAYQLDVNGTTNITGALTLGSTLSNGSINIGKGFITDICTNGYIRMNSASEDRNLLVAVGNGSNSIATSTDGINWTGRGSNIFTSSGRGIAWNGNMWIALGSGNNSIAVSSDGINWGGLGTKIFSTGGFAAAWNGNMWVAVGEGTNSIARSSNGIDWVGLGTTNIGAGYDVAWNGSLWVVVGGGTDKIVTSSDGITWVPRGAGIFSSSANSVAWNGSMWVVVGTGLTNTIATSSDGLTWVSRGNSVFSAGGFGVAWNGSLWVALGTGTNTIATSSDGVNWTGLGTAIFSDIGFSATWNGSIWTAVGLGSTNTIATSPNGVDWTGRGKTIFTTGGYDIAIKQNDVPFIDISGGSISNISTLRTGNIITLPTSNSIGGVTLNSSNISNVSTIITTSTTSNSIGGVVLSNTDVSVSGRILTGLTSNFIGGVTFSNADISLTSTGRILTGLTSNFIGGVTFSNADISLTSTGRILTGLTSNFIGGVVLSNRSVDVGNGSAAAPAFSFINDLSSGIHLNTRNSIGFDTSGAQVMCISGTNVGIGTATPSFPLVVSSTLYPQITLCNSSGEANITIAGNGNTDENGLKIVQTSTNHGLYSAHTSLPMTFVTNGNEGIRIVSSGFVGINSSAPVYHLDVGGSFRASSSGRRNVLISPTDIDGCVLWLDASDSTTITSSGGTVSEWRDKSPSSNNLSQATAGNRPSLTAQGLIQFNGTQSMTSINNIPIDGNAARSMFAVMRAPTSVDRMMLTTGTNSSSSAFGIDANRNVSQLYTPFVYGNDIFFNGFTSGNPVISFASYDTDGQVLTGRAITSTAGFGSLTSNITSISTGTGPLRVGSNFNGQSSNGLMYEFIEYNTALTTEQRERIEGYLAWKWGIQSYLPVGHPYVSSAPVKEVPTTNFMCISGNNVGIGTTDPQFKLSVVDTSGGFFYTAPSTVGYNRFKSTGVNPSTTRDMMIDTTNDVIIPTMYLTTTGRVGIGTATPAYQLQLSTDSAAKPTTNTWTISSDRRIKQNIADADVSLCYDVVKNLKLKRFTWDVSYMSNVIDRNSVGWIAQDVSYVFPNAITRVKNEWFDDFHSLDVDQIYKTMYGALEKVIHDKELLETRVATLEQQLSNVIMQISTSQQSSESTQSTPPTPPTPSESVPQESPTEPPQQ